MPNSTVIKSCNSGRHLIPINSKERYDPGPREIKAVLGAIILPLTPAELRSDLLNVKQSNTQTVLEFLSTGYRSESEGEGN